MNIEVYKIYKVILNLKTIKIKNNIDFHFFIIIFTSAKPCVKIMAYYPKRLQIHTQNVASEPQVGDTPNLIDNIIFLIQYKYVLKDLKL